MTVGPGNQPTTLYTCSVTRKHSTQIELDFALSDVGSLLPGHIRIRPQFSLVDLSPSSPSVHSFVGEVIEADASQAGIRPGNWVIGFGQLATEIMVPVSQCLAIDLPGDEAAAGWALFLAVLRCIRSAGIQLGESTAILGHGLVGRLAVQYARLSGSTRVVVLGFRHADDGETGDKPYRLVPLETPKAQLSSTEEVDVLIDTAGDISSIQSALVYVSPHGKVLLMAQSYPSQATLDLYPEMHRRSIKSQVRVLQPDLSTNGSTQRPLPSYLKAVRSFLAAGTLSLDSLVEKVTLQPSLSSREEVHVRPDIAGVLVEWPAVRQ